MKELLASGRGKRISPNYYFHCSFLTFSPLTSELLEHIKSLTEEEIAPFNVLKLNAKEARVSFLYYQNFEADPFPCLIRSTTWDLDRDTCRVRSYAARNPPILHRKELLLPENHPEVEPSRQLTQMLEDLGLFKSSKQIGHRQAWQAELDKHHLVVRNRKLVKR